MKDYINIFLGTYGVGSSAAMTFLSGLSYWCQLLLPITGVLSFLVLLIINRRALADFFRFRKRGV